MSVTYARPTRDINLLPWRAQRRRRRQHSFLGNCALSMALGIALALLWLELEYTERDHWQRRLGFLNTELARLDARLQAAPTLRGELASSETAVAMLGSLDVSRSQTLRLLMLLATSWTYGVRCQNLYRIDEDLILTGTATGNAVVAKLMGRLEATGAFAVIKVNHISQQEQEQQQEQEHEQIGATAAPGAYFFEALLKLHPPPSA